MNVSTKIRCPCGGKGAPIKGGALQQCKRCGAVYDGKPNEHGRALHTDPERNAELIEREERRGR